MLPSHSQHALISVLVFERLEKANIENLEQVQATLNQNPNAIQNIYQNANTFPPRLGWTWKYWTTHNFLKFHLNIWLTLDTYPFPSCQHQETCYFFSKYRHFSVMEKKFVYAERPDSCRAVCDAMVRYTLKTNGASPLLYFSPIQLHLVCDFFF